MSPPVDDHATRLSSRFERAGLAVLLAFAFSLTALIWFGWPDRTTRAFNSSSTGSSSSGATATAVVGFRENSIVDRLRRLESIPRPELTLLILVGVALACTIPLVTHSSTVGAVGRVTCRLGQLFGALLAVAGVAASIDVFRHQQGLDTQASSLSHLNAAALAAVSVVLARVGAQPDDAKRTRGRITRVKRPVPRPLGVPRDSPGK